MRTYLIVSLFISFAMQSELLFAATKDLNVTYFETNQYPLNDLSFKKRHSSKENQIVLKNIDLDALKNIEKSMSLNLPSTEKDSEELIKKRMEAINVTHKNRITESVMGHFMLLKWDIKKLPAFVFNDGESVIYGLTDVNEAIGLYQKFKKEQR